MTTTLTREEAQQVLDALEYNQANWQGKDKAVETLRARLAQTKHWSDCAVHSEPAYPAGECDCGLVPVAWADKHDIEREGHDFYVNRQQPAKDGVPLYTKREWQGLTDEEIKEIVWNLPYEPSQEHIEAIEAKLKEKNT
jgi:hypothetical protein